MYTYTAQHIACTVDSFVYNAEFFKIKKQVPGHKNYGQILL